MAVSSIRVRPSRRSRGRNESGEEAVPLDLNRDPAENLHEILQNVVKQKEVSNMRKLGHLNNFVKLLCSVGHSEEKLGFTHEEIIICLRLALLNEVKEVRAAGLRALRYLIRDSSVLEKVLRLQVDYLIARCIDIQQSNEVERTQAVRLARKMISVNARLFPSSLANSLIAVGNDGLHERDRMVRACVAIICELSLKNPVVVAQRGGLSTILRSVTACQLIRINEALITTVLHLLNHPHTRRYVRADVELEQILAPYTDFHYRHSPDSGHLKEDRQAQFTASKMSIVASFRSWSGIINLCKSGSSGLQSLIGLLCIPNMEVRKALLEVFYEIFHLVKPAVTADFNQALRSVDPSRFQDSWRLSDGFVASEAKTVLPHRSCSRVDLMDNYLALVLSAFIHSGLLEGLIEVITSSDEVLSVCATVLLGELLHMANTILPHSHSHHLHCLPSLINMAASFDITPEKRLRASAAVNHLKSFHEKKKKGVTPESLYLDHILRTSGSSHCCRDQHVKPQRDIFVIKDSEDALTAHLRDSHILNHKDHLDWNWCLIGTILKWPNISLRSHKDEQMHKFVQRLLFFYKPSSQQYGSLEAEHPKARQLTVVGCQFVDFLLISEEDGQAYLEDLVRDIAQCLFSAQFNPERLSGGWLLSTLSQHYFLFLGSLSAHTHGVRMLERCSVFQSLLSMCSLKNQEHLLKLTVSTLDYSRDGLSRVILSKVLTAANDTCRLYATKHLRVLLRAGVEFFSNWGVELLVTQLYDRNKTVSMEALDILDEACEDKTNLHALIDMRPALSHLGDKGVLLLIRFLSIPKGFSYLSERGYVSAEMERWQKEFNLKYVELIEEQLNEALTTYRKPVNGDEYVRRSNQSRSQRPHVYLPVHLYGQLVHDKTGCQLLQAQNVVPDLSLTVRSPVLDRWEGIKQLKAALWALGHIGSSTWGLNLLQDEGVIPDLVDLAHSCEVLSIRGFLKALSFACLDKEDLLSPINQNFLQSSPSVRSVVSSGSYSSSEEFMGLALPVNINNMLHIKDTPYFQTTMSPPSEECSAGFFSAQSDGLSDEGRPSRLRPQLSVTELLTVSRTNQKPMDDSEDGGLQDHEQNTCLYCSGLTVGGARCEDRDQELTDAPLCSERLSLAPSQLEVLVQSELSGGSGCSDTVSQGSAGSGQSSEMVLGVKAITEDAPAGRVLLRKEVLRLIINLSSSVGTKNHETSLLTIKEKFPSAFDDVCLYSEVSFLLARCSFRLTSRRFIQELFQDVPFTPLYEEAETVLSMLPRRPSAPPTDC
ncbi:rapamycin-insensitive companion of mTOR-like isoform X3 [Cheilinus undulatus]|uniref:rapamycin-insensitive companion of mTOR-like isoform X3 n=1 Tax=Cheilinus undulatus TaxID=241271 RepID=UPI001BD3C646|nr:rapamycin-insensitive companion of mTOR-like isoform X3 [Cheilinus undulatus]